MVRFPLCRLLRIAAAILPASLLPACRDVSRFSSRGDHFEGTVVRGPFVRTGIGEDTALCLTLDAEHLQDGPGTLSTSDGRFHETPLRPIPQIWHDPLSTMTFGEGSVQSLVYMVTPTEDAGAAEADVTAIVSLMKSGDIELRLVRGAPTPPGASVGPPPVSQVFGVFPLARKAGACSF